MDFSQVKAIEIPEGSVKQITDSQGRVLWKKNLSYIIPIVNETSGHWAIIVSFNGKEETLSGTGTTNIIINQPLVIDSGYRCSGIFLNDVYEGWKNVNVPTFTTMTGKITGNSIDNCYLKLYYS